MWRSIQWRVGLIVLFPGPLHPFPHPHPGRIPCPSGGRKFCPRKRSTWGWTCGEGCTSCSRWRCRRRWKAPWTSMPATSKTALTKKDIPFKQVERTPDGKISVILPDSKANDRFSQIRADQFANLKVASFREQEGKFQYLAGDEPERSQVHRGIGRPPGAGDHPEPGRPVRGLGAGDRSPGGEPDPRPAPRHQGPPAGHRADRPDRPSGVQAGG